MNRRRDRGKELVLRARYMVCRSPDRHSAAAGSNGSGRRPPENRLASIRPAETARIPHPAALGYPAPYQPLGTPNAIPRHGKRNMTGTWQFRDSVVSGNLRMIPALCRDAFTLCPLFTPLYHM